MKKVGIYLRSGFGNLGFGIGAVSVLIKCLDFHHIPIGKLIGCSASSFATPVLAIRNFNDALTAWLNIKPENISKVHIFDIIKHRFFHQIALLDSAPLREYVTKFLTPHLDAAFSSNAIPFEIITTDNDSGDGAYYANTPENKPHAIDICMDSAALVPFFQGTRIGGKVLLDGAFTDDMPLKRFIDSGCDFVFIVDLYSGLPALNKDNPKEEFWPAQLFRVVQISIAQHSRLRLELNERINTEIEVLKDENLSEETRSKLGLDSHFECKTAFVIAEIPLWHINFTKFDDYIKEVLVEIGYWAAKTRLKKMGLDCPNV